MKRNLLSCFATAATAVLLTLGFVACSESDEQQVAPGPEKGDPSVSLRMVQTSTTSAVVQVDSQNAESCFIDYVIKGEVEPTVEEIIASGEQFEAMSGNYTLQNLEPATDYVVLAAVRQGDKSASARVELTTAPQSSADPDAIQLNMLLEALYSTTNNATSGNYEVVIGNTDMLEWDGDAQMVLDLYNAVDADPLNAVLPNGVYEPGADGTPGTYNPNYTHISIVVDGELITSPVMGTITVDRKGAEYSILVDGILFTEQTPIKVSYTGPIQFVESDTAERVPFDTPQQITFDILETWYWGGWFYPFSDDLGLYFYTGEFDENNTLIKGYHFHLFSLYMPKVADYNSPQIEIANGVYEVTPDRGDWQSTYALPYTFKRGSVTTIYEEEHLQGSYVTYVDKELNVNKVGLIAGGTITINGSGENYTIEFDLVTEEGVSITGSYQGGLNLGNYNDNDLNENWKNRPWTTLTEDHTYSWEPDTQGYGFLMGDYIKEGLDTWLVMLMSDSSVGDYFTTELLVDSSNGTTFPTGTFNIDWDLADRTMIPGFIDYGGGVLFTYYGDLTPASDGYSTHSAPIASGTVTITQEGNEYKFVFDMTDDAGNKVTGEWQGNVFAEDIRQDMGGGSGDDHDHVHALKKALRLHR